MTESVQQSGKLHRSGRALCWSPLALPELLQHSRVEAAQLAEADAAQTQAAVLSSNAEEDPLQHPAVLARKPVQIPEEELLKQLALLESEREPAQIPELQQPALL